jgi:CRISPR-associated protein Cmr4
MFLYAVTPIHMGAGTALGVIDNPIQRERHSEHPVFAGSGIKGALRQIAESKWSGDSRKINRVFGPPKTGSDHAGAASFSDGQIVAFPVRSLKEGYVYLTSPYALKRLSRLAEIAGVAPMNADELPDLSDPQAVVLNQGLLSGEKLILESYAFDPVTDGIAFKRVADWLQENAMPKSPAHDFFSRKLASDLVMVNDTQFSFFVRNSTVVEPHVRIDVASGTAEDGGLFFTENLPPESLMASLAMASIERRKKGESPENLTPAEEIIQSLIDTFGSTTVQIGGDSTTGRGQVVLNFVGGGYENA